MTTTFMALDLYPTWESAHFDEYSCGSVACFIRKSVAATERDVQQIVDSKLREEGWSVARVLSHAVVDRSSYSDGGPGADNFHQSELLGTSFDFSRRRREVILSAIPDDDDEEVDTRGIYRTFIQKASREAYSLYSTRDRQWANGISPDGDEFFPIWLHSSSVQHWTHGWDGYQVRRLPVGADLFSILTEISDAEMLAGIEYTPSSLLSTHAVGLIDLLRYPGQIKTK